MDKKTKICISIAEKPGKFGLNFHNQGYELLNLNYVYIPLKVESKDLESTINLVRDNFHGCSVSMPHKVAVIDYLDALDNSAEKTGAVNTILNQEGKLKGYNTDYYGAKTAIEKTLNINNLEGKIVLMLGAGGVARAIAYAIKELGAKLFIANRTEEKANSLANQLNSSLIPWEKRNDITGYLLINATNIGMDNKEEIVIDKKIISNFDAIMDVVIGDTALIREAKAQGKKTIEGKMMTTYQAAKQFEIYTGKTLPDDFINSFASQ